MTNKLVVRFIAAPDLLSRIIMWLTNSLWCHCEILSRDGTGWVGAHAWTGVQKRPLDWIKPSRERCYAIPLHAKNYKAAHDWLEAQLGLPYDYTGCLGILLHYRIHSKKGRDCSNLAICAMQQGGLEPLNTLADYNYLITPETLHLSPVFIGMLQTPAQPKRAGAKAR
jgi:uncharacterized protein YycO